MNAIALQPDLGLVLAQARLYERLAESAVERSRSSIGASLGERLAGMIATVRLAMSRPMATTNDVLPTLSEYPYRG
jgi:uncharacterized protein YciW